MHRRVGGWEREGEGGRGEGNGRSVSEGRKEREEGGKEGNLMTVIQSSYNLCDNITRVIQSTVLYEKT